MTQPRIPKELAELVLAAAAYGSLVLIMWLPFNLCSGMPYETTFLYNSETLSLSEGFLYRADPLRIHTNTFYQFSFLLGEILGIGGSFVPFQVVYAFLWWARGLLIFLIARRLLPDSGLFPFCVGAVVTVHASDGALQWVGQLNQFGFIFWMLLAFYLFVAAFQASSTWNIPIFLTASVSSQYMSLWSYESQLFVILVAPICIWFTSQRSAGSKWRWLIVWYIVPATYVYLTVSKYMQAISQTYQESVLRSDWSVPALLNDLMFNIVASLQFWAWDDSVQSYLADQRLTVLVLAAGALHAAIVLCLALIVRGKDARMALIPDAHVLLATLGTGLLLVAASFPAYLILNSARSLWRTQFLSGIGSALVLAAVTGLLARAVGGERKSGLAMAAMGAVIVSFGTNAALGKSLFHASIWERHRVVMAAVLDVVPAVRVDTLFILTNVPKTQDPFGHNMWFDFALRLAYPGRGVAGLYFYDDGTAAPGSNMRLEGGHWIWDGTSMPPKVREIEATNTLLIRCGAKGQDRLLAMAPPEIPSLSALEPLEDDAGKILIANTPSPRALRRYRPCADALLARWRGH